jgi:GTP-dependent dephospho-CoA kinase
MPDAKVGRVALLPYFQSENGITVCVGDRTTERLHELGFSPRLEIVDSFEKRIAREPPIHDPRMQLMTIENPAGAISRDALKTLAACLEIMVRTTCARIRLNVIGEEDLLALPVIGFYPKQTVTFYGQPGEGMVISTGDEPREKSRAILGRMGISSLK